MSPTPALSTRTVIETATPISLAHRWFKEVWNDGREATIFEIFAEGGIAYGLIAEPVIGPEGFLEFYHGILACFADMRLIVDDAIERGDMVVVRWSASMTHIAPYGGVPATSVRVAFTGMTFARLVDGQMIESWNNWDQFTVMQQNQAGSPDA